MQKSLIGQLIKSQRSLKQVIPLERDIQMKIHLRFQQTKNQSMQVLHQNIQMKIHIPFQQTKNQSMQACRT